MGQDLKIKSFNLCWPTLVSEMGHDPNFERPLKYFTKKYFDCCTKKCVTIPLKRTVNQLNINVYNFENLRFSIVVSLQKHFYCSYTYYTLWNSENRQCLPHYWSDKVFKGTVVNRTLPSLDKGSLFCIIWWVCNVNC